MHEVLDTDYTNYAIIYGCNTPWYSFGLFNFRYVNLLSRREQLEDEYITKVKNVLQSVDYNYNYWLADRPYKNYCGFTYEYTLEEVVIQMFEQ